MVPALGAILRTLIGSGAAAARPAVAAGQAARERRNDGVRSVIHRLLSRADKQGGVRGAMARFVQPLFRPRQVEPQKPVGASAARPTMNYSQMMSNMRDPNAYQNATVPPPTPPQPKTLWQRIGPSIKGLQGAVGNAIGFSNAKTAQQKLKQGDVAGAAVELTKAIGKILIAFVTLPPIIRRWAESLVESRREMSKYNGAISAAYVRLNASQIRSQILGASANAGTTAKMVDSFRELNESMRPMTQDMRTITNEAASSLIKVATICANIYAWMKAKTPGLEAFLDQIEKNGRQNAPQGQPAHQLIGDFAAGKFAQNGQRPPLPPLK